MGGNAYRPFRGGAAAATPRVETGESGCFADEVIVDFPSVAPAVDRMRSAFLAEERRPPLSTAIRLTSRDAVEGVTIPLSVPVRCTCRRCGGRGESWSESCLRCAGSGAEVLRYELEVTVPAGIANGTRMQFSVTPPQSPPTRVELHIAVE
jgi:hypothetical protein